MEENNSYWSDIQQLSHFLDTNRIPMSFSSINELVRSLVMALHSFYKFGSQLTREKSRKNEMIAQNEERIPFRAQD